MGAIHLPGNAGAAGAEVGPEACLGAEHGTGKGSGKFALADSSMPFAARKFKLGKAEGADFGGDGCYFGIRPRAVTDKFSTNQSLEASGSR